MTGFGYLAKEGFKNVWNNRIMSIASVCVLISCLVLTGAAALFSLNVDKVVESVGKSNETSVYIKDGYSQLEAVYVGKAIEKLDNVESATFLSKEDAIKQYKSTLGDDLFAEMKGRNKLPDSFIVVMKDLSKYDETIAQIKKIDGVDSFSSHRELAKKAYGHQQSCKYDLRCSCVCFDNHFNLYHRQHNPCNNVLTKI